MKYIKPKIQILELKEDITACVCGSRCDCRGDWYDFWNWLFYGGCGCKFRGSRNNVNSTDVSEETSDLPQNKNLWEDEW